MTSDSQTNIPDSSDAVLEFRNVSFAYDGKPVLRDASLRIDAGEIVALVGHNGSGKSTVAKLASAFLLPSGGEVRVLGRATSSAANADDVMDLRKNIGLVMQNPDDQLVASIVVDEVAFGPSNLGLPRAEVIERVQQALEAVGMVEHMGANVNTLSGGQRQRIAIADALAMKPQLLILDEPTSMLDAKGQQDVRDIVVSLREKGIAILLITHSADEAELANRVIEIAEGKIDECPARDGGIGAARRFRSERKRPVDVSAERGLPEHGAYPPSARDKGILINLSDVSFTYSSKNELGIDIFATEHDEKPVFQHVALEVLEGEALAIVGPNGCGKSTLIQLMNGLLTPTAGEVVVCGQPTGTKVGANAARRNVGLCLQYPERSLFAQTVRDEIAFGPRNLGLVGQSLEERVRDTMESMGLSYDEYADRNPFGLSGGEQRKVALAGVMAMRPKVLALDEPCSSLDAPNHALLVELLGNLKEQGQTIVLVTHDANDVEALADRVFDMGKMEAYSKR